MHEGSDKALLYNLENHVPPVFMAAFIGEFNELKSAAGSKTVTTTFTLKISSQDPCHYHQHNDQHPECDSKQKQVGVETLVDGRVHQEYFPRRLM